MTEGGLEWLRLQYEILRMRVTTRTSSMSVSNRIPRFRVFTRGHESSMVGRLRLHWLSGESVCSAAVTIPVHELCL